MDEDKIGSPLPQGKNAFVLFWFVCIFLFLLLFCPFIMCCVVVDVSGAGFCWPSVEGDLARLWCGKHAHNRIRW